MRLIGRRGPGRADATETEPAERLPEELAARSFASSVFFCNSGAEANEGAFKFARRWTGNAGIVAFSGSFHGRLFASLAATDRPLPLRLETIEDERAPTGMSCIGSFLGPKLVARCVVPPDAAEFLNRVYVNGFAKLPVGKARYGVMLNDDGVVLDDGTTTRLSETQFYLTTTTAQAGDAVLAKILG